MFWLFQTLLPLAAKDPCRNRTLIIELDTSSHCQAITAVWNDSVIRCIFMARSKQSTTQLCRDSRFGLVVARGRDLGLGGIGFGTILPNEESHQQINLWPTQASISSLLYIVVLFTGAIVGLAAPCLQLPFLEHCEVVSAEPYYGRPK